jgi:capsular exopolysaccharide synthesis family protein
MRAREDIVLRNERMTAPALVMYQPNAASSALGPAMPPELPEPSIIRGILRHFWLVIVFAAVGAGGAWTFIKYARPLYTSESKIYIQPSSGPRVLAETLGSTQRSNYLYTQAELIKSSPILTLVAGKPQIKAMRTFELTHGDPIEYFRDELGAEVDRKNDIISVWVRSPYPEEAATIVNTVVQCYTDYQSMEKATNSSGLLSSFETSRQQAVQKRQALQGDLDEFKKKNPNWYFEQEYLQELMQFSNAWTQAQILTMTLQSSLAPGHPSLLAAKVNEEALANRYADKRNQLIKARGAAADYQRKAADLQTQEEMLRQLDAQIASLRTAQQTEQIFNQVQVLEAGVVAVKPSFPRRTRTMAVAIVLGGLLGAGLALLRDRSDGRMRSVEEIQTVIGLPILGVVPAMGGRRTAVARAMTVHLDPRSVVAEAYRSIRTAVYFGANGSRCKTILVTSPEPGDGKTTSASNLAIAIAQTGRSVLLLDADFRKPSQHKNLDIKGSIGLSSVLAGHEPLDRAIQRTGVEGLDILPCGPIPANPSEILNSREFGELVDTLAGRYDHILFDSPPVNAVTDARILGAVCDSTIIVLRADKSTRKAGEHARNALLAVGARLLGAVVNDAPSGKAYASYGGSYYGNAAADVGGMRHADRNADLSAFRRLPTPVADAAD